MLWTLVLIVLLAAAIALAVVRGKNGDGKR